MKKTLIFSLAMALMLGLSAGSFAANDDLGPKVNTMEGYAGLNLPLELSGGARKWIGKTSYGDEYAVGAEVDLDIAYGGVGVYGTATYDYTSWPEIIY